MAARPSGDPCLLAAVLEMPPFITLGPSRQLDTASGIIKHVMAIIQEELQFCVRVVVVNGLDWGVPLKNGSWTGMVGLVQRGEVNMSLTPVGPTPERMDAVDFSYMVSLEDYQLIYLRPVPKADLSGFVKPFTFPVWLALLVTFLFFSAITAVGLARQAPTQDELYGAKFSLRRSEDPSAGSGNRGVLQQAQMALQWTLMPLLTQSTSWQPQGTLLRVLGGTWLLACLVLVTVYGSSLKAMLILPHLVLPFTTLEQLVATNLPYLIVNGTFMHKAILEAPADSTLWLLRKQMNVTNDIMSTIAMVLRGEGAAAGFTSTLQVILGESFKQNGYCKHYLCDSFFSSSMNLVFTKGSPLTPKVSKIINRLWESGLMGHIYKNSVASASACLGTKGTSTPVPTRPLELGDFYGVFSLYIGGLCLGVIALGLEKAFPPKQRRHQDHKTANHTTFQTRQPPPSSSLQATMLSRCLSTP